MIFAFASLTEGFDLDDDDLWYGNAGVLATLRTLEFRRSDGQIVPSYNYHYNRMLDDITS